MVLAYDDIQKQIDIAPENTILNHRQTQSRKKKIKNKSKTTKYFYYAPPITVIVIVCGIRNYMH